MDPMPIFFFLSPSFYVTFAFVIRAVASAVCTLPFGRNVFAILLTGHRKAGSKLKQRQVAPDKTLRARQADELSSIKDNHKSLG